MFVSYPAYIRQKALDLRHRGMTLDEIADRLALPRTTVYSWIKDVPIPRTERQAETRRKASDATSRRAREAREAAYRQGLAEFPGLVQENGFIDFICMYIGEGTKRSRNRVAIANSDPDVIRLADYWMRRLSARPVRYSVQYHADQDLDFLRTFWSQLLELPPDEIRLQRKSNSNGLTGRTWRSVHGVLTVTASDTFLRARVQAWMECVKQRWIDSITLGV